MVKLVFNYGLGLFNRNKRDIVSRFNEKQQAIYELINSITSGNVESMNNQTKEFVSLMEEGYYDIKEVFEGTSSNLVARDILRIYSMISESYETVSHVEAMGDVKEMLLVLLSVMTSIESNDGLVFDVQACKVYFKPSCIIETYVVQEVPVLEIEKNKEEDDEEMKAELERLNRVIAKVLDENESLKARISELEQELSANNTTSVEPVTVESTAVVSKSSEAIESYAIMAAASVDMEKDVTTIGGVDIIYLTTLKYISDIMDVDSSMLTLNSVENIEVAIDFAKDLKRVVKASEQSKEITNSYKMSIKETCKSLKALRKSVRKAL